MLPAFTIFEPADSALVDSVLSSYFRMQPFVLNNSEHIIIGKFRPPVARPPLKSALCSFVGSVSCWSVPSKVLHGAIKLVDCVMANVHSRLSISNERLGYH